MRPTAPETHETADDISLSRRIKLFSWILMTCWTLFISASWFWNYHAERKVFLKVALAEARAAIDQDALYRRWVSSHGGVYVQDTALPSPSQDIALIPGQDIIAPSGKHLTLITPAHMSRQINELAKELNIFPGQAHITSLNPLGPENTPDPWENDVLRSFANGPDEVHTVVTVDGKQFLRLMRPIAAENRCLKCHAPPGYPSGTVRDGISVVIPIQPLLDASRGQIAGSLAFHGVIWLAGLGLSGMGAGKLLRSAMVQKQIASELSMQTSKLEEEIAERQTAQEALQESELNLRIVADYSSNWEYWRLPDNRFQYMSPSVTTLTGYSADEFKTVSELVQTLIHPDDRELFLHHTHEVDTQGLTLPIEMRIVCKNGDIRWIGHICQQVFTPDGTAWGWRASNQDITERKAAQTNLEELNRLLAERINLAVSDLRYKDKMLIQQGRLAALGEMINNIAHQWRQPLNNIGLIIQSLQFSFNDGTITREEIAGEIGKAMGVIMHMSRTIDDFRNFFRDDKQKGEFVVNKTVHKALDLVSSTLANHNIQVALEEDNTVTALGYQNEYAQVLLNILSNAREACIERAIAVPHIHIRITREKGRSVVYIRDNCGGIAEEIMPKIFDPYFTTRAPDKGTGIGLYMSIVIIEQNMGGSLTARNSEDGVEFRIEV